MNSQINVNDLKKSFQKWFDNQTQLREKFEEITTASISSIIGLTTLLIPIFDDFSIIIAILLSLVIGISILKKEKK